jgi:uncharacterized protein (TIGR03000 family)
MFQRAITFSATLLLAGAAVFMTAGPVQAQRGGHGGGGHGGGGHGGGGHFGGGGGGHFGGFGGGHIGGSRGVGHIGGYRGGYYGGYRGGYYGGYRGGYYGGYRGGYRHNYYGSYPYYYGSYPYSYGSYPYSYGSYPYYSLDSGSGSVDSGSYGAVAPAYTDGFSPNGTSSGSYAAYYPPVVTRDTDSAEADTTVHITVNVPADAEIWFEGHKTTSTGPVRDFESPPLTSGTRYTYEIRARWPENGHEVTQTKHVEVTAGAHINVSFPIAPKTVGQASTDKKN